MQLHSADLAALMDIKASLTYGCNGLPHCAVAPLLSSTECMTQGLKNVNVPLIPHLPSAGHKFIV